MVAYFLSIFNPMSLECGMSKWRFCLFICDSRIWSPWISNTRNRGVQVEEGHSWWEWKKRIMRRTKQLPVIQINRIVLTATVVWSRCYLSLVHQKGGRADTVKQRKSSKHWAANNDTDVFSCVYVNCQPCPAHVCFYCVLALVFSTGLSDATNVRKTLRCTRTMRRSHPPSLARDTCPSGWRQRWGEQAHQLCWETVAHQIWCGSTLS